MNICDISCVCIKNQKHISGAMVISLWRWQIKIDVSTARKQLLISKKLKEIYHTNTPGSSWIGVNWELCVARLRHGQISINATFVDTWQCWSQVTFSIKTSGSSFLVKSIESIFLMSSNAHLSSWTPSGKFSSACKHG